MNQYLKISVLLVVVLAACSDDDTTPTTEEKLKSTNWSGTFRARDSQVDQSFSILLWNNNQFDWYDITQERLTGTWTTAAGNQVILIFPGNETLVATLSDDTWTSLTPSSGNNFSLQSVSKMETNAPTAASLDNTTWQCTTTNPDAKTLKLKFGANKTVTINDTIEKTYALHGNGVLVYMTSEDHGDTYYFVFNGSSLVGTWELSGNLYSCTGAKQP